MLVVYHRPKYLKIDIRKNRSFRAVRNTRFNQLIRKKFDIESNNYTFYNDTGDLSPFLLMNLSSDSRPIEKIIKIKDIEIMKSFMIKSAFTKNNFINQKKKFNCSLFRRFVVNYLINDQVMDLSIKDIKLEYDKFRELHLEEILKNKRRGTLEPISYILYDELDNIVEEI